MADYSLAPLEVPEVIMPTGELLSPHYPAILQPVFRYTIFPSRYDEGYNAGYTDGYSLGYDAGYTDGYDEGYDAGYTDGQNACPDNEPPKIVSQSITPLDDTRLSITATSDKPGYLIVIVEDARGGKVIYPQYVPDTSWNLVIQRPKTANYQVHLVLAPPIKQEVSIVR